MTSIMVSEHVSHNEGAVYDHLTAALQGLAVEEAIRKIREFLTTFPSFALAHNDIGVLYHRAGNPTLALAHYEKAARLQPDTTLFRKNLADFYAVELGWLEEAVDIYLDVLKRNPRDTEALIALGHLGGAMAGSRTLEAPPEHQQLVQSAGQIVAATVPARSEEDLCLEVQQQLAQANPAAARSLLEELVERRPENAVYHNDLGVACYQLGDYSASQRCYEYASKLQPNNPVFARNLADLYYAVLGRTDDAIYIYLDLHKKSPRDVETLMGLGHISKNVGRMEEAMAFYRRVLEIEPWSEDARQALEQCRPVDPAPRTPASASIAAELSAKASALLQQGNPFEARLLQEQAINLNPQAAVLHNDLGVIAYQQGDLATAEKAYEQASRLEPDNPLFAKNLADLYFTSLGRQDEAIHIYLELHRKFPNDSEVLAALGQICCLLGKRDEAACFYRRILTLEPWNSAARDALAVL